MAQFLITSGRTLRISSIEGFSVQSENTEKGMIHVVHFHMQSGYTHTVRTETELSQDVIAEALDYEDSYNRYIKFEDAIDHVLTMRKNRAN